MSSRMRLLLTRLPLALVEGIYKSEGDTTAMPARMRMLESGPCAESFALALAPIVIVSDMFRSAESSLKAMQEKKGVQPPSFSHHNYGRAIDLDVGGTIKRAKVRAAALGGLGKARLAAVGGKPNDVDAPVRDKRGLDLWMAERGWFCFAGDHKTGRREASPYDESWHFDYFGDAPNAPVYPYRTDRTAAWANCTAIHAAAWKDVTPREAQQMLAELKLYSGSIDGIIGPVSKQAIRALQRSWKLAETGSLDAKTIQMMVYVTAERVIVDMQPLITLAVA